MQDLQLAAQATQAGQQYAQFGANLAGGSGDLLRNMYGTQSAAYSPYQTALTGARQFEDIGMGLLNQGVNIGQTETAARTQGAQQQYGAALAGAQAKMNLGQTGLGSVYDAAGTGALAQYNATGTGAGQQLALGQTGLGAQYQAQQNPFQYGNYYDAVNRNLGATYGQQLNVADAQALANQQQRLYEQNLGILRSSSGAAYQTPNAPWGQAPQYGYTGSPIGGMLSGLANNQQFTTGLSNWLWS